MNEIPDGKAIESRTLKAWTGGDAVEACAKFGHPFTFYADGTVALVGNRMPELDFSDEALWNRATVVPFEVVIPKAEQDRTLRRRFDRAGLLAWLVEGHRAFAERGLDPPDACRLAKRRRHRESDPLVEFWAECVEAAPIEAFLERGEAHAAYRAWAQDEGIPRHAVLSRTAFARAFGAGARLHDGARASKRGGLRGWLGLRPRRNPAAADFDNADPLFA